MGSLSTPTKFESKQGTCYHALITFLFFNVIVGQKNWAWTIFVHYLVLSADNYKAKEIVLFVYSVIERAMAVPMSKTRAHLVHR
jgi:hypothetical protein